MRFIDQLRFLALLGLCAPLAAQAIDNRTANDGQLVMQDVPEIPDALRSDLTRYQNTRSASVAGWTANGKSLYIRTRFGETDQLHRVDQAGGARTQLTFASEPIGGLARQPGSDLLLFTRDAGGNEFSQVFAFDPQTAHAQMLTDGESRNGVVTWKRDGSAFAFQSTRRNGKNNDIWMMRPGSPDEAEAVLEVDDGHWWGPIDFAQNGQLLVQEYVSSTVSAVHVLNPSSGEMRRLDEAGGEGRRYAVGFGPGDSTAFYLSDAGGEFTQLVREPLQGDTPSQVVGGSLLWDVESAVLSDDRRAGAMLVNAGGVSELYMFDPATLAVTKARNIPRGVISGLVFSPDGTQLAMTINSPVTAGDAFVYTPASQTLTRWTTSEVGGLDTASFIEPETIAFTSFDGKKIPAFVYRPDPALHGAGPHPVIVSIHGGPEGQARPYFSSTYQLWLNKLGAAVVVPNVRGSAGYGKTYLQLDNGYKRYDSVKDIGALLDWIDADRGLDGERVAVFGGSYGGFMVLASAVEYSARLRAAVDIVGISNFVTFLKNTQDYRRDLRRVEYGDERDPGMNAFLERISPSNNVEKIKVPTFVVQGQNDPRVPVTEAEQIVTALRENGNTVWYMNALNEGHGYRKKANVDEYRLATMLFFQTYLLPQ